MKIIYYLCTIKLQIMTELRIKDLCTARGITQAQLAKRMGTTPILLSKALHRNLTVEYLERIARALDCEVADLFREQIATLVCPHCGKSITIKTE